MLFSSCNDDKLMFVHRVDEIPNPDNFPFASYSCFEMIYLISGDVSFTIEGTVYNPKPRDIMIFDKNKIHKTNILSSKPYERIVIRIKKNFFIYNEYNSDVISFFNNNNFLGVNLITPNDFKDDYWEKSLKKIINRPNSSISEILSFCVPFFCELKKCLESIDRKSDVKNDNLLNKIIEYINSNLASDINPEEIAEKFFISRSKLDKLFRSVNNSSVCEYITIKRLHMARNLIEKGLKPTKIYLECGFRDYTTFYRCYKSKFGISPKEDIINYRKLPENIS